MDSASEGATALASSKTAASSSLDGAAPAASGGHVDAVPRVGQPRRTSLTAPSPRNPSATTLDTVMTTDFQYTAREAVRRLRRSWRAPRSVVICGGLGGTTRGLSTATVGAEPSASACAIASPTALIVVAVFEAASGPAANGSRAAASSPIPA